MEQTATYWPQVPLTIAALLSHSAGLLNLGPLKAKALGWELVLTASNCNSNSNCNWLQLTQTVCGTVLYNCLIFTCFQCGRNCTKFNPSTVKVIPWYLRPDAPVIYTGASLNWQLGWGPLCYIYDMRWKSFRLLWVSSWLCDKLSVWCKSEPGFDPNFEYLMCLITLKCWDTINETACM